MTRLNENYLNLKESYLFSEIAKRVNKFAEEHPDKNIIRLGIGEIVGCSERETDYDKLVSAMESKGITVEVYKQYLDLRRYGGVPHSGFGMGLDRMVMYLTGMSNIRDVLLYPRAPKELK